MYLKSLILKGFKSFADRSVFSLEPGVTAIVGPNGSGKSNVSDAVLWVLGERNAKNLRGQAMEDVIFAGSSARKAQGVAEVDLVLDNSDGTLPIEYTEVALTRRMYRNGESEYLINGTPARRMDVMDILHDTGLGTGTHSIISQGHLSGILQSKPEDRRALIEEAAGVLKHKQRKVKSERKLEKMDAHLLRVKDVVAEVERQVKPLERKAKRAMAYQGLADELAELSLSLAVDDLRILRGNWAEVGQREDEMTKQLAEMKAAIDLADKQAEDLQAQLQSASEDAGSLAARYRRAQAALDKLDSTILLLHEKKRSNSSYVSELRISLDSEAAQTEKLEAARTEAVNALEQARAAQLAADAKFEQARVRADEIGQKHRSLQGDIDRQTHRRREALQELEVVRAQSARTQEVLASNRAHEQFTANRVAELESRLSEAAAARDAAARADSETAAAFEAARKDEERVREESGKAFTARDEAHAARDTAREQRDSYSAQVKSLEELERASQSANRLLSWVVDHQEELDARMRPLLDELTVPNELEGLVETLLGADVSALFVQDQDSAARIASRLVETDDAGAVILLPRADMQPRRIDLPASVKLIDRIECTSSSRQVAEALLGDVAVCETVEQALDIVNRYPGSCAATLDGVVVWPNGKTTFMRKGDAEANVLARHRSLEEAREGLRVCETVLLDAEDACAACDAALREAQSASLALSQKRASLEGAAEAARKEAARTQSAWDSLVAEGETLQAQREAARKALDEAEPDAAALESKIGELTKLVDESKELIDAKRDELNPVRKEADAAQSALADARLEAATCKQSCEYAQRIVIARDQDIETARRTQARARANIRMKMAAAQRIDPLLDVCESLAQSARARTQQLEEVTAKSQSSTSGLHAQINDAHTRSREAHASYDAISEQLSNVRVDKGRLEMQVEAAVSTITDDCNTPVEKALELPELEDRSVVEERAFKLQRRIKSMGVINPDAAQEYEQLKGRYDYLCAQLEDMLAARRSLARIVSVIDERMKDDFVNTFAQVNENFQEIFGVLFPGGSGSLSLVDPEDPENTGVEVHAQPNGKRILKMSLMSGGEQSLVAMALLFAVYKTRSTPFYILDEIEAALDDTNLRRMCAYLDSMRHDTQFIMITHQRRTMEMADVLYGISMQSDGVTKVMSQRLDKALRYAEG